MVNKEVAWVGGGQHQDVSGSGGGIGATAKRIIN